VEISIRDEGIGIDPQNHDLIFKEFQQVDSSTSRRFEGTGLGLALVRKFVELHGGIVKVVSTLGSGSTFTVTLPRLFRGLPPSGHEQRRLSDGSFKRVLVIEEELAAYETIDRELASRGYSSVWARSGEEGVELARSLRPAAITLDVILPGIDGWRVLKMLKDDRQTRATPIVMVSLNESRELGFAFGADEYIVKPLSADRLVAATEGLADPERREFHVLVIDDDTAVHQLIDEQLIPLGYKLAHAYEAEEGWRRAAESAPDLVVVDLMMQQMSGLNAAMRLQKEPKTQRTLILALAPDEADAGDFSGLRRRIGQLVRQSGRSGENLPSLIDGLVKRSSREEVEARS
jgi:CheY-like chemotaxis protein